MTYQDAIEEMKKGKRVKNERFTPNEFFEMHNGVIVCEMGYNMSDWYKGLDWQRDGWSLWCKHD